MPISNKGVAFYRTLASEDDVTCLKQMGREASNCLIVDEFQFLVPNLTKTDIADINHGRPVFYVVACP